MPSNASIAASGAVLPAAHRRSNTPTARAASYGHGHRAGNAAGSPSSGHRIPAAPREVLSRRHARRRRCSRSGGHPDGARGCHRQQSFALARPARCISACEAPARRPPARCAATRRPRAVASRTGSTAPERSSGSWPSDLQPRASPHWRAIDCALLGSAPFSGALLGFPEESLIHETIVRRARRRGSRQRHAQQFFRIGTGELLGHLLPGGRHDPGMLVSHSPARSSSPRRLATARSPTSPGIAGGAIESGFSQADVATPTPARACTRASRTFPS